MFSTGDRLLFWTGLSEQTAIGNPCGVTCFLVGGVLGRLLSSLKLITMAIVACFGTSFVSALLLNLPCLGLLMCTPWEMGSLMCAGSILGSGSFSELLTGHDLSPAK